MPSAIASLNGEVAELVEDLVDRGVFEDRHEAATHMVEYAAANKYDL